MSAIGTNSANGILRMVDVDPAVAISQAFSKSSAAIGALGGRRSGWQSNKTLNAQHRTSKPENSPKVLFRGGDQIDDVNALADKYGRETKFWQAGFF